jgi:hypothetical protein
MSVHHAIIEMAVTMTARFTDTYKLADFMGEVLPVCKTMTSLSFCMVDQFYLS